MSSDVSPAKSVDLRSVILLWSSAVQRSEDWRRFLIALVSGVLSVLALAPFFFWPILFVTISNLVWLIDGTMERKTVRNGICATALNGWVFGFGYFSAGLFWVGEAFLAQSTEFVWLLPFAVTLLPAGLALFFAGAAAVARAYWRPSTSRIFMLAATLAAAEWLRGHVLTGFPWNTLGYAFTAPIELMQMTSVIGVYSLSLWVVLVSALPLVLAADAIRRGGTVWAVASGALCAVGLLAGTWAFGAARLDATPSDVLSGVKLRIVQPSIPQREKWVPDNRARIFSEHLKLSGTSPTGIDDGLAGITHVIWPEVALPFLPLEVPEALNRIAQRLPDETYLITGGLRRQPIKKMPPTNENSTEDRQTSPAKTQNAYNSLLVFDHAGRTSFIYDKIHLVPFGEYLPFQQTLEAIGLRQLTQMRGGFTSGKTPRPRFDIGNLKSVSGLICYEAIFPGAVLQGLAPNDRPSLFINLTNDGWFGNTTGPRQHFHQARVRAVETGIPLVRAANNGISAMIDPTGRIVKKLDLNSKGTLDSAVPKALSAPLYAQHGDALFFLQLLCFLGAALFLTKKRDV